MGRHQKNKICSQAATWTGTNRQARTGFNEGPTRYRRPAAGPYSQFQPTPLLLTDNNLFLLPFNQRTLELQWWWRYEAITSRYCHWAFSAFCVLVVAPGWTDPPGFGIYHFVFIWVLCGSRTPYQIKSVVKREDNRAISSSRCFLVGLISVGPVWLDTIQKAPRSCSNHGVCECRGRFKGCSLMSTVTKTHVFLWEKKRCLRIWSSVFFRCELFSFF